MKRAIAFACVKGDRKLDVPYIAILSGMYYTGFCTARHVHWCQLKPRRMNSRVQKPSPPARTRRKIKSFETLVKRVRVCAAAVSTAKLFLN
jgi:hypothetical protein